MQTYMQTIADENVQAITNYANKSAAGTNATETLKEQITELKEAQTTANEKIINLTGQVSNIGQDYSGNNNQQVRLYNQRKDQYKFLNHQQGGQGGRGGRGNRRGNDGNPGRGYNQPEEIIKYGYCW